MNFISHDESVMMVTFPKFRTLKMLFISSIDVNLVYFVWSKSVIVNFMAPPPFWPSPRRRRRQLEEANFRVGQSD